MALAREAKLVRPLPKPRDDPLDVFLTCISKVRDADLKARLSSIELAIVRAAKSFEAAVLHTTLHKLVKQASIGGLVTVKEMSDMYDLRMAKKGAPGRQV